MARVVGWLRILLSDGARASSAPALGPREARNGAVLAVCAAILAIYQWYRAGWFIDDAAISFAYARNLAHGHGLVPFPGGERVEAYSDPLWVLILAAFELVGLDGMAVGKPLGFAFALAAAWTSWRIAEQALPEHTARGGPGALLAPLALALSAQFGIWSTSGLENALFGWILALAIWRAGAEIDAIEQGEPRAPVSAGLYFLLALTRPEGLLYAGAGFGVLGYAVFRARRGLRPLAVWLVALGVPLVIQEAWRLWYFAWPLPNTFYAKVTARGVEPTEWDGRGWFQLRQWSERVWHGYLTPVYLLGLAGAPTRRFWVALAAAGLLLLSLLWPGIAFTRLLRVWPDLPDPPHLFVVLRMVALLAFLVVAPAIAIGSPGGRLRALCGWSVVTGLAFHLVVTGDWMSAFRFMSLIAPPLAVLFACGLVVLADELQRRLSGDWAWSDAGWIVVSLGLGLQIPPNVWQLREHIRYSMDETVAAVKLRVDHTRSIVHRTFWDEPVTNFENDQGAHLWYAPDFRQLDMAMLIDIPMSRHWFQQRAFVREYLFEENPPTFAQIRLWWVNHTGLQKYPEFQRTMFKLPGYQSLPRWGFFDWCWGRRALVMTDKWSQPGKDSRRVQFDWDLTLEGFDQPAPWARGGQGYLEVPFSVATKREAGSDVQVVAFLSRGQQVVASWSLPMGYGFYPMEWWKPNQIFRGRHAVPVPRAVQPGKYDLGFVITGPKGRVIPALELPAGATADTPVFAAGEVRFPQAITVLEHAGVAESMSKTRAEFQRQIGALACDQAEKSWIRFQRHRPEDWDFHDQQRPVFAAALAECWAKRAGADPGRAPELLGRAHRWDPLSPTLTEVGRPVGAKLLAEGKAARAAGDWQTAYDRFAALLSFEPWQAWARRWAEEARDHRLGLTDDVRYGQGGEDDLRKWEEAHGTAPPKKK